MRLAPTTFMQVLYGVTLASIAFALAITFPALLPFPETPALGVAHAQAAPVSPRSLCGNIFDDTGSLCAVRPAPPSDGRTEELTKCVGPELLGIVHGESTGCALFAGSGVVKPGEVFGRGYALVEVHTNRTVLAQGNARCEVRLFQTDDAPILSNDHANGFAQRSGRVQVPRAELMSTGVQSLARLRAVPTLAGFRVFGVVPNSFVGGLGLRSGDVIVSVDGQPITPDVALEIAGDIANLERLSALVRRGDEEFTLQVDITD